MSELTAPECQRLAELCSLTLRSEPGYPPWYSSDDYTVDASEWHPDTDRGQCFMVLDALTAKGVQWNIGNMTWERNSPVARIDGRQVFADTPLLSAMRAALMWLDRQKGLSMRGDWHPDSGDPKRLRAEMDIASKGLVHGEVKVCPNCEGKGEYS